MIVGFTGTRYGMRHLQSTAFRALIHGMVIQHFHHGQCVGADFEAHNIIMERTAAIVHIHPPTERKFMAPINENEARIRWYKPKPYLRRNANIVQACDILIACPYETETQPKGGTWRTISMAKISGTHLIIINPAGMLTEKNGA